MGTHPIFESDFDCLTEKMGENLPTYEQAEAQKPAEDPPELPPAYSASVKLPTYEKACEEIPQSIPCNENNTSEDASPTHVTPLTSEFIRRLIMIENGEAADQIDRARLGNDWHFILYFLICFLFNWVGLFVTFCCSTTAAARYGGLSGFGLSLVKWVTMLRYNPEYWNQLTRGPADQPQTVNTNAFVYLFLFIGLLLFFKGAMTWCRFRHLQAPMVRATASEPTGTRRVVIQREV